MTLCFPYQDGQDTLCELTGVNQVIITSYWKIAVVLRFLLVDQGNLGLATEVTHVFQNKQDVLYMLTCTVI